MAKSSDGVVFPDSNSGWATEFAPMEKLADSQHLGCCIGRCIGSSPIRRTEKMWLCF